MNPRQSPLKPVRLAAVFLLAAALPTIMRSQQPLDRNLLGLLTCPETTEQDPKDCPVVTMPDVNYILNTARAQPDLRKELSTLMPKLLRAPVNRLTLINEAHIAGELQLASTVRELAILLGRPDTQIATGLTFTSAYLLDDDPIGKALADIGTPALPVLKQALKSEEEQTRERAARVLILMNTRESFSILRRHVSHESDTGLKRYISANLASAEEQKHERGKS